MRTNIFKVFFLTLYVNATYAPIASAGVTTALFENQYGACMVRVEHDAVPGEEGVIVVRLRVKNAGDCRLTSSQLSHAIGEGVKRYKSNRNLAEIESVFIGRIYRYQWLSDYLVNTARKDAVWNNKSGKPVKGSSNHYVNTALFSKKLLKPILGELAKFDYKITGVSCEKVLINDKKLPYDAMCWFRLK